MQWLTDILQSLSAKKLDSEPMPVQYGEWPAKQVQKVEVQADKALWADITGKVFPSRSESEYKPVIDALCASWVLDTPYMDAAQFAYAIATIEHECGFESKEEQRANPNLDAHNRKIWEMQNRYWHTGYYGRGLPQLTWRDNYVLFGRLLSLPLARKPELVMDVEVGARIVLIGIWHGLFTGRRIDKYISVGEGRNRWDRARAIYNGDVRKNGPKIGKAAQALYNEWKKYQNS